MRLTHRIIKWLAELAGLNPLNAWRDKIHENVDVHAAVDAQGLNPKEEWSHLLDPIQEVKQIEDDPSLTYAWIMPNASQREIDNFGHLIEEAFYRHYGHPPYALHVPLNQVEDVRRLNPDQVKALLGPYMTKGDP